MPSCVTFSLKSECHSALLHRVPKSAFKPFLLTSGPLQSVVSQSGLQAQLRGHLRFYVSPIPDSRIYSSGLIFTTPYSNDRPAIYMLAIQPC